MRILLSTSKWYHNAWAALIFFTRLPFWKIFQPPKESYRAVVEFWPFTGWLTASVMASVLFFCSFVMPYGMAVAVAILVRLLLTGALHEDGLADFCDGFGGGGNDRQRILDIMKDSRIGTYGVIGLVSYLALLWFSLCSLPPLTAALAIFAADPFSKMLASQIIQMMPYARTAQEAKNRTVYRKIGMKSAVSLAFQGLLPSIPFILFAGMNTTLEFVIFVPCLVMYFLYLKIWRTLGGYTGDCCGALFLLVELSTYITLCITYFTIHTSV